MQPSVLKKFDLLNGLSEEQLENIIPLMVQAEYDLNDTIITEGKSNDKIYFIINGQVEIIKGNTLIARLGEGSAFGDMEVLDVIPATASARALSQVSVLTIANRALRAIYNMDVKTFSLIIMNLARELSRRLRKMDETLASLKP